MIASVTGESTHKKKTLHDSNKTLRLPSFISTGVHLGLMIRARRWSENEKYSSLFEMCGGKKVKWSGLAREFVNNSPLWGRRSSGGFISHLCTAEYCRGFLNQRNHDEMIGQQVKRRMLESVILG